MSGKKAVISRVLAIFIGFVAMPNDDLHQEMKAGASKGRALDSSGKLIAYVSGALLFIVAAFFLFAGSNETAVAVIKDVAYQLQRRTIKIQKLIERPFQIEDRSRRIERFLSPL